MKENIPHQAFRDFISVNSFESIQQAIYKLGSAKRFNQAVKDFYAESLKPKPKEIPRFDLRTNKSIEELVEMAQRPFTKAQDLHKLSQQQCDLFEFETDCFCKYS